jgi:hypothetical protein
MRSRRLCAPETNAGRKLAAFTLSDADSAAANDPLIKSRLFISFLAN